VLKICPLAYLTVVLVTGISSEHQQDTTGKLCFLLMFRGNACYKNCDKQPYELQIIQLFETVPGLIGKAGASFQIPQQYSSTTRGPNDVHM